MQQYNAMFEQKFDCFYIKLIDSCGHDKSSDLHIANILDISINDYQNYLIKTYNAYIDQLEIFFKNEKDVINAIEWINSILIANQLSS